MFKHTSMQLQDVCAFVCAQSKASAFPEWPAVRTSGDRVTLISISAFAASWLMFTACTACIKQTRTNKQSINRLDGARTAELDFGRRNLPSQSLLIEPQNTWWVNKTVGWTPRSPITCWLEATLGTPNIKMVWTKSSDWFCTNASRRLTSITEALYRCASGEPSTFAWGGVVWGVGREVWEGGGGRGEGLVLTRYRISSGDRTLPSSSSLRKQRKKNTTLTKTIAENAPDHGSKGTKMYKWGTENW